MVSLLHHPSSLLCLLAALVTSSSAFSTHKNRLPNIRSTRTFLHAVEPAQHLFSGFVNTYEPAKINGKAGLVLAPKLENNANPANSIIFQEKEEDEFPLQTLLKTRRTINNFEVTLPPNWKESLKRAITAATFAPNHKRTEPWKFHLLGPETIVKVCALNADIVAAKKGVEAGEKKLRRWLDMPGWLVVTCQKTNDNNDGGGDMENNPMSLAREDYAAVCCAIQNLCLSLHSEGLGTKWTTGPVNFDARFAEAVGFDAEKEYVVGTIWFGTPKEGEVQNVPKKKWGVEDVLIVHD